MKPWQSALYIAVVLFLLCVFLQKFPAGGITVTGITFRVPVRCSLTPQESPVTGRRAPVPVPAARQGIHRLSFTDSLLRAVPPLEMADSTRWLLYRLLQDLDSLRTQKKSLHILYYGDSQIEGDRITSVLRDSLQRRFGGGGPGFLLPVMTVSYTATFVTDPSPGWVGITHYGPLPSSLREIPIGLAGGYSLAADTLAAGADGVVCRITVHGNTSPRVRRFTRVRMWLWAAGEGISVGLAGGKQLQAAEAVPPGRLTQLTTAVPAGTRRLVLQVRAPAPLAVEGIVLDDTLGVGVDNIPLRGRPFMSFSRCDSATVVRMFDDLHVRMVVLQFGLNVAAGSMDDVRRYRRTLRRELGWLRHTFPGLFVLVVGVTDIGGGDPHLQERLQWLRREQRAAALAHGCAYWDASLAMGGTGAIQRWAAHQPPLVRPDQVHLSREGARLFATLLLRALMENYQEYADGL